MRRIRKDKKKKGNEKRIVFLAVLFVLLQTGTMGTLASTESGQKTVSITATEKGEEGTTEDKEENRPTEEGTTEEKEKEEGTTEVSEEIRITAEGEHGNILLNGEQEEELSLEKGTTVRVTIIPKKGYAVEQIYVNGEKWTGTFTCNNEEQLEFLLEEIAEDQKIEVVFLEISELSKDKMWFDEDYISQGEQTYIYNKDKKVFFYTDMDGIRLYRDEEKSPFVESKRWEESLVWQNSQRSEDLFQQKSEETAVSVCVSKSSKITGIEIYGKIGCQYVWQKVTGVSKENYLYIVIDEILPRVQINPKGEEKALYYREDIEVNITAEDPVPYSGIKKIQYWVEKDGNTESPTQEKILYDFNYVREDSEEENNQKGTLTITDWSTGEEVITKSEGVIPAHSDLKASWKGTVNIDADLNNSCNVKVFVKVTDNAGNETVESVDLDIDHTAPVIDISYDNNTDNDGNTYFNDQRSATVVITERTHHFNGEKAIQGITITAKDAKGVDVEDAYTISEWETVEGETPDEATHKAVIFFEKDANYTLDISYTDEAGNKNEKVNVGESKAPFQFTVDTTAPTGTLTAESAEGRKVTWDKLKDSLTFGFWSKKKITISATAEDATSAPMAKVEYYKVQSQNGEDHTTALTKTELDQVTEWQDFVVEDAKVSGTESNYQFEEKANQQFVVYLKITDLAGNYTYISTNGLIVDDQAPMEEVIAPEITITPEQPVNGIYNRDVKVAIQVKDPMVGGTHSGLKKVTYEVKNMGKVTQTGTLYRFEMEDPKQTDLKQSWSGEITVDSEKNNSNDVEIIVYAQDNAENDSEDNRKIKIDITAPKITVSYNNNASDSDKYFKENRTATIVVTERNFNAKDVITTINNTDGFIPKVSAWKKGKATGNGDDTTWTATVKYTKDGDYTFGIQYTDLAGNKAKKVEFAEGTVAGKEFTIDKTIPKITVSYDNNQVQNGNYYKAARTATITVTEHNFDAARVIPSITANDNGKSVGTPNISSWKHKGDVHTATLTYQSDALYTFDISMKDKAGNEAIDYAEEKFYVDKTLPRLTISGVKNHSANAGDVIPMVSFSDTNFDAAHSTITLQGANRGSVKLEGSYSNNSNGRTFTFKNFAKEKEVDDIYTLTASTTDKAGNTVKQTITFSVNRFGSTYEFGKTLKMMNGSYVKEAEAVVLTEINPDALKNVKITLFKNNETIILEEGEDYTIQISGGNGEWYRYKYTIFKENFAENGVYRITISSEDIAGNVAENTLDTKSMEIGFGVDGEKPLLNITNLENQHTYPVEELTVLMTASDNLVLSYVTVYLDGIETPYAEWTMEEIAEVLSDKGEFTFTIAGDSKSAHEVRVLARDAAGNETIEEIKGFYVTTDLWIRFVNNKLLLYGTVTGMLLLLVLVLFMIYRRKKKEELVESDS